MTISISEQEVLEKPEDREVVLSVQGVSKKFCRDLKKSLFYGVQDIASELLGVRQKSDKLRKKEFWALKDLSFELRRGEALGLVGPNGSGKTTLLRIIAGLIRPDTGSVEIQGRVAPLIALGAGFNPILTGRENIYANMSILGLSKQEIDERFDAVVDFAEIGDAIDAPVQSYSSGMAARLGFACAIHTEPEILLIDEVLAVGDLRFREKCFRRLHELQQKGTAFVLVSHQSKNILNVCKYVIYLLQGHLVEFGEAHSVIERYERELFIEDIEEDIEKEKGRIFLPEKPKHKSLGLDIRSIFFRDAQGEFIQSPLSGKETNLCLKYKVHQDCCDIDKVYLFLTIFHELGGSSGVLRLSSFDDDQALEVFPGEHELRVCMPYLGLKPGLYNMSLFVKKGSLYTLDFVESFKFLVEANKTMNGCLFYQPREWKAIKCNASVRQIN